MIWFIAALLIYPTGQDTTVYNQAIWFYDQQSCYDYIVSFGMADLIEGVRLYLDQSFGINHGITVDSIYCDGVEVE